MLPVLITGWGNFPQTKAYVFKPSDERQLRALLEQHPRLLARGKGRSYGDASLAPHVVSMLGMNRILSFDAKNGILTCEAGVSLSEILKVTVPQGWFFKITPGTKAVTIGGAIAANVHGKNHPSAGCFSNSVLCFDLMTAEGQIIRCSKHENSSLFWQTCGGMGWTGIVLRATVQLMRIPSTWMRQKTLRAERFEDLFEIFAQNDTWPYSAAWVDFGHKNWRGTVFLAEHHVPARSGNNLVYREKKRPVLPFYAPQWMLNPLTSKIFNTIYHFKNTPGEKLVRLEEYFYPLDALPGWNKLYGRRGFLQYQCCIPEKKAVDGLKKLLQTAKDCSETPFLVVLKRHGAPPPEAVHSFPCKGYSMAMDFPRNANTADMVHRLDEVTWEHGGKVYLAKDACSSPKMSRINPKKFGSTIFRSLLRDRIERRI